MSIPIPYTAAHLMDLHLEKIVTFTFPATRHTRQIPTQTLASLTAHRAGTAMGASLLEHSWQDRINLHQMK